MVRTYYPHIYFEAARPRTRDSVTQAVGELDRKPGVTSFEEYKRVALAQLADYIDKLTVNHRGRVIRFSKKLFNGRTLVLIRIGRMKWPKKYRKVVETIKKAAEKIDKTKSMKERRKIYMETARYFQLSRKEALRILRRVSQH